MRAFLPSSYLLFSAVPPSTSYPYNDNVIFRVRAFLYTDPAFTNPYLDLTKKPFIEVVSRPISTKTAPSIPGLDPVPIVK